jgi:hypothetical protein
MALPEFQFANPVGAFLQGKQTKQAEQSNALSDLIRQRQLKEFDTQDQTRQQQGEVEARQDLQQAIAWVNQGANDAEKAQRWDQAVDFYVKSGRPQAAQYKGRVDLLPMLVSQLPQPKPEIREVAPGTTVLKDGKPVYQAPFKPEEKKPPSGSLIELVSPQGQKQTIRQDDPQVDAMVQQGWKVAPKDAQSKPLTAEAAGKVALYENALRDARSLADKLIIKDAKGNVTGYRDVQAVTPANWRLLTNAIRSKLRAESGATITQDEVEGELARYGVSAISSDQTNAEALTRLISDLENQIGQVQGGGRINQPAQPSNAQEITAVNPQTGERIVLRNGQWVPYGR